MVDPATLGYWADFATIVTAFAVVIAVLSFINERNQRHRDFEGLYVQRYWDIQDRHSPRYRLQSRRRLSDHDRALILDYLRLCEDELEIRKLGLVTHKTWKRVWSDAIATGINSPACQKLIKERPGEFAYVRKFDVDHRDPYPGSKGWLWPWSKINGL